MSKHKAFPRWEGENEHAFELALWEFYGVLREAFDRYCFREEEEVILVSGAEGIEVWRNFCQHETDQRLDRGFGAAMRDGEVICPKHGSSFDADSDYCDNGKAEGSFLSSVSVTIEDDMPSSTPHLSCY